MGQFRKGDKVTVIDGGTHNRGTEGRTGVIAETSNNGDGLLGVKGIDSRLTEAVKGLRCYTADQLKHSA